MPQDLPASLDLPTIITNLSILVLSISAVIAGIYQGLKKVKSEDAPKDRQTEIKSAMILETVSMTMWSESNRQVSEELKSLLPAIVNLAHQIERLRDKIE